MNYETSMYIINFVLEFFLKLWVNVGIVYLVILVFRRISKI